MWGMAPAADCGMPDLFSKEMEGTETK